MKPNLKSAISWAILTEIVRRHGGTQPLRVLEMHPGNGQYDCLALVRLRDFREGIYAPGNATLLGTFNRQSGTFQSLGASHDDTYPFLDRWLIARDPTETIDIICGLLGFAPVIKLPTTSRRILGIRLISAIVGARALQRDYLDVNMAYDDSSGISGSDFDTIRGFTALFSEEHETNRESQAAECWMLRRGTERRLVGVMRTDGYISSVSDRRQAHDLFESFRPTRQIEPVLFEALALLQA